MVNMPKKGIARCIDNNEWRVTVILIAQGVFNLTLLKKTLSLGRFDTKSCLMTKAREVEIVQEVRFRLWGCFGLGNIFDFDLHEDLRTQSKKGQNSPKLARRQI